MASHCEAGRTRRSRDGPGEYYEPGQIETLVVLDIDGTVVVINANLWPGASAADRAEFAAVLDSIRIDRRFDTIGAEVITPLELVRGSLTSGADVELFRVTTDEPTYWRLTTLPEFDGRTWGSRTATVDDRRHRGLPTGRPHHSPAAPDPGAAGAAAPRRRRPHAGRTQHRHPIQPRHGHARDDE